MSSQPPMGGHLANPQITFCIEMNLLCAPESKIHFACVTRVAAQSRLYCTGLNFFENIVYRSVTNNYIYWVFLLLKMKYYGN